MTQNKVKTPTDKEKWKYSRYLSPSEKIVAILGIGDRYFWTNIIVLVPLSLVIIGLPLLLKIIHLKQSRRYILTDRRVIIKDGFFTIKITTVPYDKITHISVQEEFLKKISYGIGDIKIHTAATGPIPIEIDLENVDNPMHVKNLIEELIIKERSIKLN